METGHASADLSLQSSAAQLQKFNKKKKHKNKSKYSAKIFSESHFASTIYDETKRLR